MTPEDRRTADADQGSIKRMRNAVILPDGTKREPMGSGVITGLLGVGGMANVYEIWNPQLEVNRAVKLLHPNYTEDTKQRFQTEIKITAKLHHPNIIEIHAVGQWNGLPYIEMERIDGQTLEKIIEDRGALPVEVAMSIGIMIGRALRYAHNQNYVIYGKTYHGVIHRDLKPSNIMVSSNGIVKLMDFGIARPTDASIHTTDGAILGTMQYLSPEQLDGKEPDIRTDIYSLGTILYEMVTGMKAFPEQNVSKLMLSKIKNDYKPLDAYDIKIPSKFRRLIHMCMVQDREKRIQDAMSFLSEIGKIHRSTTPLSPEQELARFMGADREKIVVNLRRKNPFLMTAAVLLIVLGVFATGMLIPKIVANLAQKPQPVSVVEPAWTVEVPQIPEEKKPEEPKVVEEQVKKTEPRPIKSTPPVAQKKQVAPVAPAQVAIATQESLIDQLKRKHGTNDLMSIFTREVESRQYKNALEVYESLSPQESSVDKAMIFRIRALKGLGRRSELNSLFSRTDIKDGEFYLEKAKFLFNQGRISEALNYLDLCSRTPGMYVNSSTLRLERLYFTAQCRSRQFDQNPTAVIKRDALDSWYEVKSALQTSKDHRYYKEADAEMQRIASRG